MTWWTAAWIGWGLYFAAVEALALANSTTGDTLSEHCWAFIGMRQPGDPRHPSGWTRLRRFLMLAFMAWLSVHFLTGGAF